jgi:hypothetical protein
MIYFSRTPHRRIARAWILVLRIAVVTPAAPTGTYHADPIFSCADCGDRFRNSRALLDHLLREHPERVERCKDGDARNAR